MVGNLPMAFGWGASQGSGPGGAVPLPDVANSGGPPVVGTQGMSPFNRQEQMKKLMPLLMLMGMFPQQQARSGKWQDQLVAGLSPAIGMGTFAATNAILGNPFGSMMSGMGFGGTSGSGGLSI